MSDSAKPQGFTVVIPARLASSRLPNKPLADIAGHPPKAQADLAKVRGLSAGWKDNEIGRRMMAAIAARNTKIQRQPATSSTAPKAIALRVPI